MIILCGWPTFENSSLDLFGLVLTPPVVVMIAALYKLCKFLHLNLYVRKWSGALARQMGSWEPGRGRKGAGDGGGINEQSQKERQRTSDWDSCILRISGL